MALAGISLLTALWGGLARLGWPLPLPSPALLPGHGPLFVVGFLGTMIGLERAVALKRCWAYGAPIFAGASALALLAGFSPHAAHALAAAAGALLVSIFAFLYRRQAEIYLATMGTGALLWLVGTLLWHGGYPLYRVVFWWIGFLVLTIAGERLELTRLMRPSTLSRAAFLIACGLFVLGLITGLASHEAGVRLGGAGLLALAVWLLKRDIAWRNLSQEGLSRFMAVCLLSGYLWLGVGGLLWLFMGGSFYAGPAYDAMVHAIFLGFVFSMIFGHAPLVLPSVMGVALPFRRAFYGHWALLHLSLALRVGGGLAGGAAALRWGGLLNGVAILLFLVNNVRAVRSARQE